MQVSLQPGLITLDAVHTTELSKLFSIHCLAEALLSLRNASNGAELISIAASQCVSVIWVNLKKVVYSETDLQREAPPSLPCTGRKARPTPIPVQSNKQSTGQWRTVLPAECYNLRHSHRAMYCAVSLRCNNNRERNWFYIFNNQFSKKKRLNIPSQRHIVAAPLQATQLVSNWDLQGDASTPLIVKNTKYLTMH